jgi:hypothetical protein
MLARVSATDSQPLPSYELRRIKTHRCFILGLFIYYTVHDDDDDENKYIICYDNNDSLITCIYLFMMIYLIIYSLPPYKWWGSVAELTCHLQGSTPYGIRFSHKTYRPSPTKGVTWKDPAIIRGPLIGGYTVYIYIYIM